MERVIEIMYNKQQINNIGGEIIVKIDSATNLPEVPGKPNFIIIFKLIKYNQENIVKKHISDINQIFKDDLKEYIQTPMYNEQKGTFKSSKQRINIPNENMVGANCFPIFLSIFILESIPGCNRMHAIQGIGWRKLRIEPYIYRNSTH